MKRATSILLTLLASVALFSADPKDISLHSIVIDAGHGGKDPGAVSADRVTFEKSLTLDIAKRLAEKIRKSYPEVTVNMTRTDDSFVSLDSRAVKANRWDAQLFISIHINSCKSTGPNGYSVHVLGQSNVSNRDLFAYNMDVCKRENSVILLEDDYSTKYQGFNPSDPESFIFMQLMQNAYLEQSLVFSQTIYDCMDGGPIKSGRGIWQNPFYVLWKTSMPAVLVELGFISNPKDLAELRNADSREQIANSLFSAFVQYKAVYDESVTIKTEPKLAITDAKIDSLPAAPEAVAASKAVEAPEAGAQSAPVAAKDTVVKKPASPVKPAQPKVIKVKYGTQVFTIGRDLAANDPALMGFKARKVPYGKLYKYIIGISESEAEARKNFATIKKKYKDAYLVKIDYDGSVSRY